MSQPASPPPPPPQRNAARKPRFPGEEGVWMFVLGDLAVFGLFFATYLAYRAADPAGYGAASASLSVTAGAFNTLMLLTSSWLVALAVLAARGGAAGRARRLLYAAIGFGLAFAAGKISEYAAKAGDGVGVETHEFFMFYFVFTGIHFVHVSVGLILLTILAQTLRKRRALEAGQVRTLESAGLYWHMVDLLWIVLFALFYLVR